VPSRLLRSLGARADQAGMLAAAVNVPLTFQRTLMPRTTMDQALVTGLSIATNHALASLVQETVQATGLSILRGTGRASDDAAWGRITLALDAAAIGAGILLQRGFRQQAREPLPRAAARTGGWVLAASGFSGAVVGGVQESIAALGGRRVASIPAVVPAAGVLATAGEVRRRRAARRDQDLPPEESTIAPGKALALGALVAGTVSVVSLSERLIADAFARAASRVLPGTPESWRPLGHAVALGAMTSLARLGTAHVLGGVERRETAIEEALDVPPPNPLVSGSLDSLVPFAGLSKQGRRFVWTVTQPKTIRAVLGEDDVLAPIRVYAGLESADTDEDRVRLVVEELERTGAFERAWLLVDTPTGTGYVNYAAVGALELLSRGDCATMAMQYSARPSVLSLNRVAEGRNEMRLLFAALRERLQQIPAARRPKVLLFGESLGAWASQDVFVGCGTQGLVDAGIDYAIWIGTPHMSKWKEQVLRDARSDVDPALLTVCADIEDWRALPPDARARVRYVMVTHHDDGVALFGPELAIQAPEWLGPSETRPPAVPRAMRWMPTSAFLQVLVDMKNSATVVPGVFAAKGHDYRADLLPFFHEVLGFRASDAQLQRIADALAREEKLRTDWIAAHGTAGKSLAATIVERAMVDMRAQGVDPNERLAQLMTSVAEGEFLAGGGAAVPTAAEASDGPAGSPARPADDGGVTPPRP
jgi:uncharacterized membrane protein